VSIRPLCPQVFGGKRLMKRGRKQAQESVPKGERRASAPCPDHRSQGADALVDLHKSQPILIQQVVAKNRGQKG
jgi:hypothetical protein